MLQRNTSFCIREISEPCLFPRASCFDVPLSAIFYLHRGFFAKALQESPNDTMSSIYSKSVLQAYNSACKYVALVESWYRQEPVLMERLWFIFSHMFSCCVSAVVSFPFFRIF